MISGMLIVESLRVGAELDGLSLVVRKVRKLRPTSTTPDQPDIWTLVEFDVDEAGAAHLAQELAAALDEPGWYVDFHSSTESLVTFPGRVFRYRRGDAAGRSEAEAHARSLNIPNSQLDWPA